MSARLVSDKNTLQNLSKWRKKKAELHYMNEKNNEKKLILLENKSIILFFFISIQLNLDTLRYSIDFSC